MSPPIRIVIADDYPAIRTALVQMLDHEPDMVVVGHADTAPEALCLALRECPNVLVLDAHMPGLDCATAVRRTSLRCPSTRVVIYDEYDGAPAVRALLRGGARGFVAKDDPIENLVEAVRTVAAGGTWLRDTLRVRLEAYGAPRLTPREQQVLEGLVLDKTQQELAKDLGLSERAVRHSLHALYDRFGVNSRVRLAVVAVALGLVDPQVAPWTRGGASGTGRIPCRCGPCVRLGNG